MGLGGNNNVKLTPLKLPLKLKLGAELFPAEGLGVWGGGAADEQGSEQVPGAGDE